MNDPRWFEAVVLYHTNDVNWPRRVNYIFPKAMYIRLKRWAGRKYRELTSRYKRFQMDLK